MEIIYYLLDKPVKIGESFKRLYRISNQSDKPYPGGRLFILEDAYYHNNSVAVPSIRPYEHKEIYLEHHVKGATTIHQLPPTWKVSLDKNLTKVLQHTFVDFVKDIFEFKSSNPKTPTLNILLFGIAGATKSSFLNSVYTLLEKDQTRIVNKAAAGGGASHVTTKIGRYEITPNVRILDTWGLSTKNYDENELLAILDGKRPVNWSMNSKPLSADQIKKLEETAHLRKIHGVLFFVPQAVISDPQQATYRTLLQRNFQTITSMNMNPLLVVTKVDELCGIRNDLSKQYPQVAEITKRSATCLNIASNRVMYNLNYINEKQRAFNIDKLNYMILREVLQRAVDFCSLDDENDDGNDDELDYS
eukprot:TRINITY_DN1066_c0_g1_i8.p1 TRINITY_DN1066_c0_g1~~TRINITY_DN1066_c0_g1_i8.p1  ORF type:complete len:361 (+),score=68.03 TRINITY_DN1066_c0_g1_i8:34-1116(+)